MADRCRSWRCLTCGMRLGEKVAVKGGYARLLTDLMGVRAVETVGTEIRHTCRRCGAVKVWYTAPPVAESA